MKKKHVTVEKEKWMVCSSLTIKFTDHNNNFWLSSHKSALKEFSNDKFVIFHWAKCYNVNLDAKKDFIWKVRIRGGADFKWKIISHLSYFHTKRKEKDTIQKQSVSYETSFSGAKKEMTW